MISDTYDQRHFSETKPILVPPTYASFSKTYTGSSKFSKYHVGISIVDYSYMVGRSIGILITFIILKL